MRVELDSPCKVNFILNILGRRPDGFHEVETVMHPVAVFDQLALTRQGSGISLTCNHPELPTDSGNLVYRAAEQFLATAGIGDGVSIHLEKGIPLAAGLGGGSGNAATTLLGLNTLFDKPLTTEELDLIARSLGSDVPFFLYNKPALGVGKGEKVTTLPPFTALKGWSFFLIHPGFGVSTPWAYKNLARFPAALNGTPGRASKLIENLSASVQAAAAHFYNSLEAPVLEKFLILRMYQEFLLENGAAIALMSGSGSTTFALVESPEKLEAISERFRSKFGPSAWTASVPA